MNSDAAVAVLPPGLQAPAAFERPGVPPPPESWAEVGISQETVADLVLKILYVQGSLAGSRLMDAICLPFELLDQVLLGLQHRRLVEVRGTTGHARISYVFDLTGGGRERAREAMASCQYAGPAPVPLAQYVTWMDRQTIRDVHVTRARIAEGFRHIVLDPATMEKLGPAINSAKSLFLYGESGNGKTLIAAAIAGLLGGSMYVPHAVDVDGQVIVVHDPVFHRPADPEPEAALAALWRSNGQEHDRRFARVRRPVVVTGGELTLPQLDLQYDPHTKLYQAPFQVKANGGVLIIDDFGRQQVAPRDLLNRWIVPLEQRVDYLTLHTGGKFPVPFDCLLIISTNLDPRELMDEAFLRRIHYKILVDDPTRERYEEIFRRCCSARGVEYTPRGVEHVFREFYGRHRIAPRSCHPRDVVDHLCDVARYLEVAPALTPELLDPACASYFLDMPDHDVPAPASGRGLS
jgi:predicted ATPase with chaperone activity